MNARQWEFIIAVDAIFGALIALLFGAVSHSPWVLLAFLPELGALYMYYRARKRERKIRRFWS